MMRALVTTAALVAAALAVPSAGAAAATCGPLLARHAWAEAIGTDGTVRWTTPLPLLHDGGQDNQTPLASPTTGYFAQEGVLHALSLADGHELWAQPAGGVIYGEWLVAGGVDVLSDQVGTHAALTRYDAVTGATVWRYAIAGSGLYGSQYVTRDGGLVWLREGGILQVVDLRTGRIRWSKREASAQGVQYQSPTEAAYQGEVLFLARGRLVAYDDRTGKSRWVVTGLPGYAQLQVSGSLALVDGDFFNVGPTITAVDLTRGKRLWRYAPAGVLASAAISHDAVVVTGYNPNVPSGGRSYLALQPRTGKTLWSAQVFVPYTGSPEGPSVAAGHDVVAVEKSLDRYPSVALVGRDARTGHVRWRVPLHGKAAQPDYVSVVGPRVLVQSHATGVGRPTDVVAYALTTGTYEWTAKAPTYTQFGIGSGAGELLTIAVDPGQGCAS